MHKGMAQKEAVRQAKEKLGEATSEELAAYIQEAFGLSIKPPIVAVLLGTFREREFLDQTNRAVRERMEAWKAENPEEARKLAATAKRKEAARRRKAEGASPQALDPAVSSANPPDIIPTTEGEPASTPDPAIPDEAANTKVTPRASACFPCLG